MMERLDEIDFLRGICIFYMILGHIIPSETLFDHYIHAFHMPVFFVVSGLFFNRNKQVKMFDLIKRNIKKFLIPYFIFGLLFLLFATVTKYGLFNTPKQYLINLFTHNGSLAIAGALWFLISFFFVTILFNLLNKIRNDYLFIIASILIMIIGIYFYNLFHIKLILSLQSALVGVGLMQGGVLLKKYKVLQRCTTDNLFIIILVAILNYVCIMKTGYVNMRISVYPNIFMFLFNVFNSIILYISVGKYLKKKFSDLYDKLVYFGQFSIFSLCLNQFFILIINIILGKLNINLIIQNQIVMWFIVLYLVMFITYMFTKYVLKTKIKYVFGK